MADPFILRERFQGKKSSSLSSAAIITGLGAAVPGSGAAQAGAKLQGASDRLTDLFVKQRNTQNALLAKANTTEFALATQKELQQIEKSLQWNPQKNSWGVVTDSSGKEQSYYEAVSSRLGPLRNRFKVGEKYQDEAYESVSSSFFQNTLLKAADRGLQLDADKIKKNYEIQIDSGANLFGIEIGEQLAKAASIGEFIDPNNVLRQVDKIVSGHIADLIDGGITLGKDAMEDLTLDTRSRYSESLINQLLLKEDLSTVEQVLEIGLKQSVAYDKGKDKGWEAGMKLGGSLFFLDPTALKTVQRRISVLRGKLPPGLNRQLTLAEHNVLSAIETGNPYESQLNKYFNTLAKLGSSIDGVERMKAFEANRAAASDFNKISTRFSTTPINQHNILIDGFNNSHVGGIASHYAIGLEKKLATASTNIIKSYNADSVEFALTNDEVSRNATIALNDAKIAGASPDKIKSLGEQSIRARLNFQKYFNPSRTLVYQTKEEIKKVINQLNLEAPNIIDDDVDRHMANMKQYFDQYGEFAGNIYNELRDPSKYMEYSGPELNSSVGIALTYGDSDTAMRIITADNQKEDLFDAANWPPDTIRTLKDKLIQSDSLNKLMSSFGYIGYLDYTENDFVGVFQSYVLSLASQGNRREVMRDLNKYIKKAEADLIDSKYSLFTTKTGTIGFRESHYLAIPKSDSDGNPYDYELTERAIETMLENPAVLNLTNEEISMVKSNGIFINNEDGTGFSLAYGSKEGVVDSGIDFKWKKFNSTYWPEIFSVIPNTTSEDIKNISDTLKKNYEKHYGGTQKKEGTSYKLPSNENAMITKIREKINEHAIATGQLKKDLAINNMKNARKQKQKIDKLINNIKAIFSKLRIPSASQSEAMIKRNN
tara:strand:+ start:976 stop:3624 length:2649 start_codon:yes stop_codon:yes gene_type:complete